MGNNSSRPCQGAKYGLLGGKEGKEGKEGVLSNNSDNDTKRLIDSKVAHDPKDLPPSYTTKQQLTPIELGIKMYELKIAQEHRDVELGALVGALTGTGYRWDTKFEARSEKDHGLREEIGRVLELNNDLQPHFSSEAQIKMRYPCGVPSSLCIDLQEVVLALHCIFDEIADLCNQLKSAMDCNSNGIPQNLVTKMRHLSRRLGFQVVHLKLCQLKLARESNEQKWKKAA